MLEWPRSRRLVTTMKTVLRIFSPHYCLGQGIYQLASTGGNANQSGYNPWAQEASFQPPQQSQAQRANGAASVKGWAGRADKLTIAAGDWSLYTINARPGVRLLCIHTRCRGSVRETSTPGLFLPDAPPPQFCIPVSEASRSWSSRRPPLRACHVFKAPPTSSRRRRSGRRSRAGSTAGLPAMMRKMEKSLRLPAVGRIWHRSASMRRPPRRTVPPITRYPTQNMCRIIITFMLTEQER